MARKLLDTSLDAENSQRYFQASVAFGQLLAQSQVSSSTKRNYTNLPNLQSVNSELDCFLRILSVFLPVEVNLGLSSFPQVS